MNAIGSNIKVPTIGVRAYSASVSQSEFVINEPVSYTHRQVSWPYSPTWRISIMDLIRANVAITEIRNTENETGVETLESEFEKLSALWKRETSFHSSLGEVFTHEAYQRIIGMGRDALPMILKDLQKNPGLWFYALEKIVGSDVAADAKNYADARAAWLEWGYRKNHI